MRHNIILTFSASLFMNCAIPEASCCGFSDWVHVKGKGEIKRTLVFRAQSRGTLSSGDDDPARGYRQRTGRGVSS